MSTSVIWLDCLRPAARHEMVTVLFVWFVLVEGTTGSALAVTNGTALTPRSHVLKVLAGKPPGLCRLKAADSDAIVDERIAQSVRSFLEEEYPIYRLKVMSSFRTYESQREIYKCGSKQAKSRRESAFGRCSGGWERYRSKNSWINSRRL